MKERKGAPKAPLMALGGEAEGNVDESAYSVDAAAEYGDVAAYEPQFDSAAFFHQSACTVAADGGESPGPQDVPGGEDSLHHHDEPDDDIVDRVAQALFREFLNKRKLTEVLAVYDREISRDSETIQSRRQLRNMLGLGEPTRPITVLEQVIAQRLADAEHGSPHMLGDGPTDSPKRGFSFKKPVPRPPSGSPGPARPGSASSTAGVRGLQSLGASTGSLSSKAPVQARQTASGLTVGGFVMSEGAVKREGALPTRRTLCDMKTNKIIDNLSDINFDAGEKLGKGAGGEVRSAVHRPTGVEIAVKLVSCNEKTYTEIDKELKMLADHKCPYIIAFHGCFFNKGENQILIVMERMRGSLHDASQLGGKMDADALCSVAWQMLRGLEFVHCEKKIIHRDLKPANLLFNERGEVKVSDFGVSSRVSTLDGQASTFVGTMVFMSPERCQGVQYTYSSDIWSVGLIIYSLATTEKPYPIQLGIFAVIEGAPPRIPPELLVGAQCAKFVEDCVQKDPRARPEVQELLQRPWFSKMTDAGAKHVFCAWLQRNAVLAGKEEGGGLNQSKRRIDPVRNPESGVFDELDGVL